MSEWTQPLCARCWPAWTLALGRTPRQPVSVMEGDPEVCVACRTETRDGIYVRCDPKVHEPWAAAAPAAPEGGDSDAQR